MKKNTPAYHHHLLLFFTSIARNLQKSSAAQQIKDYYPWDRGKYISLQAGFNCSHNFGASIVTRGATRFKFLG
jgi:hypothetical protein